MSQVVIIGQVDLHPEDATAAAGLMRTLMEQTVKEAGCHHYAYARDLIHPTRFQLSELWEDEAALGAHLQTAHVAAYRAGLSKLRVERRSVKRYDVAGTRDL